MNWYPKKGSSGQGLVIDEDNGRTVAVAYDEKDAPLIAAAPELLAAIEDIVKRWESGDLAAAVRHGAAMAKKARGEV